MMQNKVYTKKPNGNKWNPVIVGIVGAVLGSSGSIALVFNTPAGQSFVRPDPYTGTQASALAHRVGEIETDLGTHITTHPDATNQYDRRITTLEVQFQQILDNQRRILDRLEKL